MAKRKLSPLVQAMNLFAEMDDRDKQTLADYVRTQTAAPRKKPEKTTTKKKAPSVLQDASKPELCGVCGNLAEYRDHFKPSPNFHEFEGKSKAAAA
jgi:hypothetical protein